MTKVKLRTLMASPMGVIQPGTVAELPDEVANELILKGFGEAVEQPPKKAKKKKGE